MISPSVRAAALASLGLLAVGFYATFWEPFRLAVRVPSVPVAAGRDGLGSVRIGVLIDLQTDRVTPYERGAIDRLLALEPDLILLPGDLFHGTGATSSRVLPAAPRLCSRGSDPRRSLFRHRRRRSPFVRGPSDARGDADRPLVNRVVRLRVGERRFALGGCVPRLRQHGRPARRSISSREAPGDEDFRILSPIVPTWPWACGRTRGSTCRSRATPTAARWSSPVRPPHDPERRPSRRRRRGSARPRREPLYVSRGVGCERGRALVRFLCPPEITLLTIGDAPSPR